MPLDYEPRTHSKMRFMIWFLHRRYLILFILLIVTIAIQPTLSALGFRIELLDMFAGLSLLVAISDLPYRHRGVMFVGLTFAVVGILIAGRIPTLGHLHASIQFAGGLIAFWAATEVLRRVFRPGRVDSERLFASMSAYLIYGLGFGALYAGLSTLDPDVLRDVMTPAGQPLPIHRAIYFSLITMTTVGFGDIVPNAESVSAIAMIEAVFGQIYTTVLVAWLVSLYVRDFSRQAQPAPPPSEP